MSVAVPLDTPRADDGNRAAEVREHSADGPGRLAITVVSQDSWLTIRPRLYESTLEDVHVLDDVLQRQIDALVWSLTRTCGGIIGGIGRPSMSPLDSVRLSNLMALTSGSPEIAVGLIDGPVDLKHPSLHGRNIRSISTQSGVACAHVNNGACMHGTFVTGILCANRDSTAPAICPDCTLLVRPVFSENTSHSGGMTSATPGELAVAIVESINAGARILNMSLSFLHHHSSSGARELKDALDYAAQRGVIAIAAAGNQGTVGSSTITHHPWVIPVVASDVRGRPLAESNLGSSIGTRGISAPGDFITSLRAGGTTFTSGGTSVAVPFVTGTAALLWSMFPGAGAAQVKLAVTQPLGWRRAAVVPPLLDAWAAYRAVQSQIKVGA